MKKIEPPQQKFREKKHVTRSEKLYIQIPHTGYVNLMLCSTAVTTANLNTVWQKLLHTAVYPRSTLNDTLVCSTHIGTVLYETQVAGQEESGCANCRFQSD